MAYSTISKPSLYFNTKLYTGNGTAIGSGGQAITGVGFQPDWVWIKERSSTSPHKLLDAVRGVTKELESNLTNAESTQAESLASFNSDGFTVGSNGAVNENSQTYASWNWKANGAGSANTDGSINSTVSANTTAGFSIVKYTGAGGNGTGTTSTVGHGLGAKPKMIIVKSLSNAWKWVVYHEDVTPNNSHLQLNETAAVATSSYNFWNTSGHTTTTFGLGEQTDSNGNGVDFIAYCFAEKTGYSKFGSYTGNGNADGTFIYTGFKPAFVMIKNSTNAGLMWNIRDNKRETFNPNDTILYPNSNEVENAHGSNDVDFLSNGFKMRSTNGHTNGSYSGNKYIYMAFGQSLVGSNNVPCTAR
jgi:hypothetical protein